MELFLLYIWMKLGVIAGIFLLLTFVCALTALGNAIYVYGPDVYHSDTVERAPKYRPIIRKWLIKASVLFFVFLAIPSQTQTAMLVGGHLAIKAVDTPEAGKVLAVLRKKANELLDEQLESKK